jgi:hypothetical protein
MGNGQPRALSTSFDAAARQTGVVRRRSTSFPGWSGTETWHSHCDVLDLSTNARSQFRPRSWRDGMIDVDRSRCARNGSPTEKEIVMAQIIWGTVTAYGTTNPTINSGSGFSVLRVATGTYLIDFKDEVFTNTPALAATQQFSNSNSWTDFSYGGGQTTDNVVIIALDQTHAKVKTGGGNGDAADRNFSFVAIGD